MSIFTCFLYSYLLLRTTSYVLYALSNINTNTINNTNNTSDANNTKQEYDINTFQSKYFHTPLDRFFTVAYRCS